MLQLEDLQSKLINDPWYTVRRYYVDKFFMENVSKLSTQGPLIDIGGHKAHKRGMFDISDYKLDIKYANLDPETEPDYLGDAMHIEVDDNMFAGGILGEVLEHVEDPVSILREAYRVLQPGAVLLITTPFMLHVHADPYDFYRYTDYWYQTNLQEIGFSEITTVKQGGFFAVLTNMLKMWMYALLTDPQAWSPVPKLILKIAIKKLVKNFEQWDANAYYSQHRIFSGHTTGFGVICRKPLN